MRRLLPILSILLLLSISTYAQCGPGEDTQSPVFAATGDGTMGNPFKNLLQSTVGSFPSGIYYFNFNGNTFQGVLDNDTDGGGWLMVLNYVHIAGDSSALISRNTDLPLLGSSTLGDNEAGSANWGHMGNQLAAAIDFEEVRFYAITTGHNREINFKTSHQGTLDYFKTGIGSCDGLEQSENFTELTGHTANLPAQGFRNFIDQGDFAMTNFPFWSFGNYHWGIGGNRWEVDDQAGNTQSTIHRVWVRGDKTPTGTTILPVTLDVTGNATVTPGDFGLDVTDNCGNVSLSLSRTAFTCADAGNNIVQLTADDGNGNTTVIDVNVLIQRSAPVVSTNTTVDITLDQTGNAVLSLSDLNAIAADDCGLVSFALSRTNFTCADVGREYIDLVAIDTDGNMTTVNIEVNIADTILPQVTCKAPFAIALDATGNASIAHSDVVESSSDNCGVVSVNLSKSTFTCADLGDNIITATVRDDEGNENTCTTTVTITIPSCPGNLTLEAEPDKCGVIYDFPCASNITNGPASGTLLPVGTTTTFTYNTLDNSGATVSCNYDVTVEDTTGPQFLTQDQTIILDATGNATITASELLGPDPLASDYTLDMSGVYNPEDISANGTAVVLGDDQVSTDLPIGFTFGFYGNLYDDFRISSNGFVTFNESTSSGCCNGQVIPNTNAPNNLIALDWTDLRPPSGGTIRYETIGTAPNRILIVDFDNVVYYDDRTQGTTVQLKLFETTNRIEIHTTSSVYVGDNKTQGLENSDGTQAIIVPGRNGTSWNATNDVVTFIPVSGILDGCGVATLVASQTTFDCADLGENTITITATDVNNNVTVKTVTVTITDDNNVCPDVLVSPKVFLQGASIDPTTGEENLMRDTLRNTSLLPETSPYADGVTTSNTVFDVTGNDAIVDWIWIELRAANDASILIEGKSALLQRDGDVVSHEDGVSSVPFNQPAEMYYIVIKHRNHLGVMTQNTIPLSVTTTVVDFSDANNPITFGSNAQTSFGMPSGILGLWSGNVNADIAVQYSGTNPDTPGILSLVLNESGNFLNFPTYVVNGYSVHDVNMDGETQYSGTMPDTPFILQNVLAHPENFLNFSTYRIQEQLPEN